MVQVFTHEDIVRYVYQETTETENAELEEAMLADTDLLDFYLDCLDLKMGLDRVVLQPSDKIIANILAYSVSNKASVLY